MKTLNIKNEDGDIERTYSIDAGDDDRTSNYIHYSSYANLKFENEKFKKDISRIREFISHTCHQIDGGLFSSFIEDTNLLDDGFKDILEIIKDNDAGVGSFN